MDMNDVIALVNTNRGNGKKENLNRMHCLMEKLDNPQKQCRFVHVAGTNGKGTTCAFMASVLQEAGLKTGLFISPHLEVINERIQINNQYISDDEFIELTEKVAPIVEEVEEELKETLYSFEILTAVAFLYFAKQKCEVVVLETGIGGRLDSTNIIDTPEVAILTSIGEDHLHILGHSLEEIAQEKAGIIKENGEIVSYSAPDSLAAIFQEKAEQKQASIHKIHSEDIKIKKMTLKGSTFAYKEFTDVTIQLIGKHQVNNACLVLEAAMILKEKGWIINKESILSGLKKASWAGRMEVLQETPTVLIDGAHNEQGVDILQENLAYLFPDQKITFVVGMMEDKAYHQMLEKVENQAKQFFFISPDPWRGFKPDEVSEWMNKKGIAAKALDNLSSIYAYIQSVPKEEIVVIFGSLYLVGEIRANWIKR